MSWMLVAVMWALKLTAAPVPDLPVPAAPKLAMQIKSDAGLINGMISGDIVAFKGIPYAAPPVGELRWRAPQPVRHWSDAFNADRYGALCMQKINPKDNGVGPPPASEDCLTLNVWRPLEAKSLPVMVWIHGGGFVNGSGTAALYDGAELARLGVVVVTINYRLGRFGFFSHPALTHAAPKNELLANYGLMDQIAALKWVQRNAAAFGGNASNVTIFGESAGGMAVQRLMISPATRGLFHKAIVESGAGSEHMARLSVANRDGLDSAENLGKRFAQGLGVQGDDVVALRALSAEAIIAAGDPRPVGDGGPIIDGKLLTTDVEEAFAKGLAAKIPFLVGSNSLEFPIPAGAFAASLKLYLRTAPDSYAAAAKLYATREEFETQFISDGLFVEPARHLAALHAEHGAPTYLYRFTFLSAPMRLALKGAPHASERQYVFNTLAASPWKTDDSDAAVAALMSNYWVTFAKSGDPNGGSRPSWPKYSANEDRLLEIGAETAARKTPFAERLDAITRYNAKQ